MISSEHLLEGGSMVTNKLIPVILGCVLFTFFSSHAQPWRMNTGGPAFTTAGGVSYSADAAYAPGGFGYVGGTARTYTNAINGTVDDSLFQSIRYANPSFSYVFDGLTLGSYEVTLELMEPVVTGPGQRLIDITAEGLIVLDNYDIFAAAGATFTAVEVSFFTFVVDGQLNVTFTSITGNPAFISAISVAPETPAEPTIFSKVTTQVGLVPEHDIDPNMCAMPPIGSGSAWADYDDDGDLDLYVTNHGGPNHLYNNQGDTNGDNLPDFTDVAVALGVDLASLSSHSCVFVDYDNDGDQDLYVTNWGENVMFRNQLTETGNATFVDETDVTGLRDAGRGVTTAWGDFDQDGFLDVYITKHWVCMPDIIEADDRLYRNNGDGTFSDVTGYLCPGGVTPCVFIGGYGFCPAWLDYDNDGDPDLYLVNDIVMGGYHNVMWRNDGPDGSGGWIFTEASDATGTGKAVNGMGLGVGDINNDGWLDIAFSNIGPNTLLKNLGNGTFLEITASAGVLREHVPSGDQSVTWGTCFFDYDNDGYQDLFYVAGLIGGDVAPQPDALFHNNGNETFTDVSVEAGVDDPLRGRSASMADFDQDGFVDLFVGNFGRPPSFYHNASASLGNTNHWLTVTVEGTVSNRDGIGARIIATTPDAMTLHREITSGPTHGGGDHRAGYFGLGANTTAHVVVKWPTGLVEDFGDIAANQAVHLVENSTTPAFEMHVEVGGKVNFTTGDGKLFLADRAYTAGSFGYVGASRRFFNVEISGTADDTIYQTMRYSKTSFSYLFDGIPSGEYDVTMYFMEPNHTSAGLRIFDVVVEGDLLLDDFDIFAESGGKNVAMSRIFPVVVTDGQLTTEFYATPGLGQAIVCGFSIVSSAASRSEDKQVATVQEKPTTTGLLNNYPNPFNPSTTIRYTVGQEARVSLKIFNTLGQEIASLVDDIQQPGDKNVVWNGRSSSGFAVPSGVYFVSLRAGDIVQSKRILLVK
jgi:hypothetical protein